MPALLAPPSGLLPVRRVEFVDELDYRIEFREDSSEDGMPETGKPRRISTRDCCAIDPLAPASPHFSRVAR